MNYREYIMIAVDYLRILKWSNNKNQLKTKYNLIKHLKKILNKQNKHLLLKIIYLDKEIILKKMNSLLI